MSESWDKRWMELAQLVSTWSKDRNTGVGCVIIDYRNTVVSLGWNGFPRGVNDDVDARHDRPIKYKFTEHAERNAIYNAASTGAKLKSCRLYSTYFLCADCARGVIQSGINLVICPEPDWTHEKWGEDWRIAKEMLEEAKVCVRFIEVVDLLNYPDTSVEPPKFNIMENGK